MNAVLDRIEHQLTASIARSHARRRRRRSLTTLAASALAALALAGAGVAAVTDTPLDRLLHGDTPLAERADSPRIELRVADDGGLGWTAAAYVSADGMVAFARVPDGLEEPFPAGGAVSGFVIAENLLDGPLASDGLEVVRSRSDGHEHYLLSGLVAAGARRVTVDLAGTHAAAELSERTIDVPVEIPSAGLTRTGADRAAELPAEVSVRPFAAALPPDALAGRDVVQATLTVDLADGSRPAAPTARFCIAASCGVRPLEID